MSNLTVTERLIIKNQLNILSLLDQDSDYTALKKIVSLGIEGMYPFLFEEVSSKTIPKEIYTETHEILDMYRIIGNDIDDSTLPNINRIKFNGFDANHDDHYYIMQIFVKDMNRYEEYKNKGFNSHSQTSLDRYRKILAKYKELNINFREVTEDHLQQLIDAV